MIPPRDQAGTLSRAIMAAPRLDLLDLRICPSPNKDLSDLYPRICGVVAVYWIRTRGSVVERRICRDSLDPCVGMP